MSWLSDHAKIRLDSHTFGNLVKNVAPLASFTPGGPLLSGLLGATGEALRGHTDPRQFLKAGLSNAAIGAGAHAGVGALRSALSGAGDAGEAAGAVATPPSSPVNVGAGGLNAPPAPPGLSPPPGSGLPPVPIAPSAAANPGISLTAPQAADLSSHPSALSRVGSFVEEHPTAVAGGLQGLGGITSSITGHRLQNAEAANLEQKTGETQYDFERRRQRDALLAPTWGALGSTLGQNLTSAAPNPYIPRTG